MNTRPPIITHIDLYLTASGSVAFLRSRQESTDGQIVFHGYVMKTVKGVTVKRDLIWLPSGHCISSEQDADRIVSRA